MSMPPPLSPSPFSDAGGQEEEVAGRAAAAGRGGGGGAEEQPGGGGRPEGSAPQGQEQPGWSRLRTGGHMTRSHDHPHQLYCTVELVIT